jgi:hypothetical protein
MGLSFTIATGPRQRRHSQVRVQRNSWPYFTASISRLPQPGGPGPCIYIAQEQGGPVIPPSTEFSFRCLLPLPGLRWRYSTPPPHGSLTKVSVRVRVTLRLAVHRQSIHLGYKPLETHDQYFFQLNTCFHSSYVISSLTRGWVCSLQLLLALASAVILRSDSCGTLDHILLSQIRDSANLESPVPPGTGWPSYTFLRLCTCCRGNVIISRFLATYLSSGFELCCYRIKGFSVKL